MTRDELVEQVNSILHLQLEIPLERLVPEANLFDDLALDSLDAVDMLVHLEDHLKVKFNVDLFKNVRTVGDVYKLVGELVLSASAD